MNISCKTKTENRTSENGFLFDFEANKENFHNGHLNSFSLNSIDWKENKLLSENDFYSIYQDSLINYLGGFEESQDIDLFYSIQNRNSNFNEITILWHREGEYCLGISYFIFDKKGKLIERFPVAISCGDGGYSSESYGHFLNDTIYKMTIEDYEEIGIEETGIKSIYERQYTILENGKIQMEERLISTDTIK